MSSPSTSTPLSRLLADWPSARTSPRVTQHFSDGARVELSGASLGNAITKAANLLTDEFDVQPGDGICVDLPLHWQVPVLVSAAWSVGASVHLGDSAAGAAVRFVAPTGPADPHCPTLAVSLHPWGLPLGSQTPDGCEDHALIVRSQPDVRLLPEQWLDPDAVWLTWADDRITGSQLQRRSVSSAEAWGMGEAGVLATEHAPRDLAAVVAAITAPAVMAGAVVYLPAELTAGDVEHITEQEGTTAVARIV